MTEDQANPMTETTTTQFKHDITIVEQNTREFYAVFMHVKGELQAMYFKSGEIEPDIIVSNDGRYGYCPTAYYGAILPYNVPFEIKPLNPL